MKNNKRSTKKLAIALLALLGVVSTGATYAYWQGALVGNEADATGTIRIGEAGEITTAVSVSDLLETKVLVPEGRVEDAATQVDEVEFSFEVNWSNESAVLTDAIGSGNLAVSVVSITVGGASTHAGLVNVDLPADVTIDLGETLDRDVTVTLTEPSTEAIYNAIINQDIIITFNFEVTVD